MKITAGIIGVVFGLFSFGYVGLYGGVIGFAASWLGSHTQANSVQDWGNSVQILSWLGPILAIVGGAFAFSVPLFGALLLAASTFIHWSLLGFGTIGNLFIFPIGLSASLAFLAGLIASSDSPENLGEGQQLSAPNRPPSNNLVTAPESFDRVKWSALVQYDKDIASVTEQIQPFGPVWVDRLAAAYLALNDKKYLPDIVEKIVADKKAEETANQSRIDEEEERERLYLEHQRQLLKTKADQSAARRYRFWGTWKRKVMTLSATSIVLFLILLGFQFSDNLFLEKRPENFDDVLKQLAQHPTITLPDRGGVPLVSIKTNSGGEIKVPGFKMGPPENNNSVRVPGESVFEIAFSGSYAGPWWKIVAFGTVADHLDRLGMILDGDDKQMGSLRRAAEKVLKSKINLSDQEFCSLRWQFDADRFSQYYNYGLSFCPNSKNLP